MERDRGAKTGVNSWQLARFVLFWYSADKMVVIKIEITTWVILPPQYFFFTQYTGTSWNESFQNFPFADNENFEGAPYIFQ